MFKINEYVYPKVLPWEQIFNDLIRNGCTQSMLANLMGVKVSTLQRWCNGTEPKHGIGEAIIVIHRRYCGVELTERRITEARTR